MKTFVNGVFLMVLLAGANLGSAKDISITISNPSDQSLTEKSIVIKRAELEKKNGALSEGQYAWLISDVKIPVIAQLDDLDGDGKWDELFTQVSLNSKEKKTFKVEILKEKPNTKNRTNIRFADINDPSKEISSFDRLKSNVTEESQKYFQFEGPGWENDVVAFRNYYDARNGIDIYGKVTTNMMLDSCGLKGGPTYHKMRSWGMDILKVANSLGAGALAFQTETGLYRLGPDCKGSYRLVVEGPIRSIIDLDFEGVKVDGKLFNVKHRISIEAGKPYYKSEVFVSDNSGMKVVTGIVNLHSTEFFTVKGKGVSSFFTHDNQAFDGEKLGMAVIVPQKKITVQTAPEEGEGITQTFYTAMPIGKQPVAFYFMVGWEKSDVAFKTSKGFELRVEKEARDIATHLIVK